MNWRALLRLAWIGIGASGLATTQSGCSLLFNLNDSQCSVTADCRALGPQFNNTACVNRVCVASGTGGAAGMSGASGGGVSGGGVSGGGSAGVSGGSAGVGGGGTAGQGECSTHADCIKAHLQQPYLCRSNTCVPLTTTDCPVLLPTTKTLDLLQEGDPLVIGAFANMTNTQDPHDNNAVINWDLALNEFDSFPLGGITANNDPRPLLALVCQSVVPDLTGSIDHLAKDIGAPAVLSVLSTDRLYSAYTYSASAGFLNSGGQPLLFLDAGSADLRLANLQDNGLVWHMLGDPRVLAATTVALLERMEAYVNAKRLAAFQAGGPEDPSLVPLRVTLVYSDDPQMIDLYTVLTSPDSNHPETLLTFNGKPAIEQISGVGDGSFRVVGIQSSKTTANPDVSGAIADLEQNPPHIVVAAATSEFPKLVVPAVENAWLTSGSPSEKLPRPYYLMSYYIYNTPELQNAAQVLAAKSPPLATRVVGVNYAQAQDAHSQGLYNSYEARLQSSYHGTLPIAGTENFYDAAYAIDYALAAAVFARGTATSMGKPVIPTANDVLVGLEDRVFSDNSQAQSVDIGPVSIANNSIGKLSALTYKMSLWGTMGPPNFDRTSGTRVSQTSAWCLQGSSGTGFSYQADGLIYDAISRTFSDPSAGRPACFQGY